jgi:hypothetical protein
VVKPAVAIVAHLNARLLEPKPTKLLKRKAKNAVAAMASRVASRGGIV